MKKLSKIIAVIFLATTILSGFVMRTNAATVDYISDRNPGVESTAGWSGPAFALSTVEKHTGSSSAYITPVDSGTIQPNGYLLMSARVFGSQVLTSSTNYILSFWVKSQATSFKATSLMTVGTTSVQTLSLKNSTILNANEFTLVQHQFKTPADMKPTLDGYNSFIMDMYTSSEAYFDDFSLVEGTLPETPSPTPSPTPTVTPTPTITPTPTPSPTPFIPLTQIAFSQKAVTLNIGKTIMLTPTLSPSNASNVGLIWISTNEDVATVNSEGKVSAKTKGIAFILVVANGELAAHCQVTVVQPVKGISLNKSKLNLSKGKSAKLIYTISPVNASNKSVVWKSSNSSVATVSSSGTVKALKKGKATISVTTIDGKFSSKCSVNVTI
ncbi:MAG: Ig-like domain-containing protein [Bacillota bacterium]